MRSYLRANPNALNAKKNSEGEKLIMSKYMLSPNERTNNITISDARGVTLFGYNNKQELKNEVA